MSKVGMAGAAVGVGGTGAAGIYGAHHMGWFGGYGKRHGELQVAKDKDGLKRENGGCIDHSFPGWSLDTNWKAVDGSDGNSVTSSTFASSNETGGCLVFNWERNLDKEGVKSGFRLVWTLSRGDSGFMVYLNVTAEDNNQMKFEGVTYVMEKKGRGWLVTKFFIPDKDSISDLKKLFPKVNKDKVFGNGSLENAYWGFLDNDGTKLKEGGGYGNGRRKWVGGQGEELKDWSPNLGDWWKDLFDNDLNDWNMTQVIGGMKGKWEKY